MIAHIFFNSVNSNTFILLAKWADLILKKLVWMLQLLALDFELDYGHLQITLDRQLLFDVSFPVRPEVLTTTIYLMYCECIDSQGWCGQTFLKEYRIWAAGVAQWLGTHQAAVIQGLTDTTTFFKLNFNYNHVLSDYQQTGL